MRLLILTQYYPPEVGAPQNRLSDLAYRLKEKGVDVNVLTSMPNYPQMKIHDGYKRKWFVEEKHDQITVYRSFIFATKSKSIIARLVNYFSFVFSSLLFGTFKFKKYDYVFCESPPLFLGISGLLLAKLKGAKLIFNVSDLWPESAEKLGLVKNKFLLKISTVLEEYLYKKSFLISGQTQGIVNNITTRFPAKTVYWFRNGVDFSFYDYNKIQSDWRYRNGFKENDFILIYAGIIGHAQGLEVIIEAAKMLSGKEHIKFCIIGSGPEKEHLKKLSTDYNLKNVFFYNTVSKSEMPAYIKSSDVAIVPLKKLDIFKGAIPSKIFENLALKKPIILGVDGEAKELFINQGNCGLYYEPENAIQLADCILKLYNDPVKLNELGENGFNFAKKYFDREKIAAEFLDKLKQQEID